MYCVPPYSAGILPVPTFLISDPLEVRKAKYSQFKGAAQELRLNGSSYFAQVVSLISSPDRDGSWLVTIAPTSRPTVAKRPRPTITYG